MITPAENAIPKIDLQFISHGCSLTNSLGHQILLSVIESDVSLL